MLTRMRRRGWRDGLTAWVFVGLLLGLVGVRAMAQSAPNLELRWGTITAGGAWQVVGAAMLEDIRRENPGITGSILPSATSANVLGVHRGTFNIAFSLTDTTASALEGTDFFAEEGAITDLRNVATLYPQATHFVVWADSGIRSIEDFRGQRVTPGARGLSSDLAAQRILEEYGMSYDDMRVQYLSFNDAAQNFIDGHLQVLLFTAVPYPFAPIINIAASGPIRLLSIPEDIAARVAEKYPAYEVFRLPGGLYQEVDYEVTGIAVRAHIIVREDMPEEVVYRITKTIAENFDRYGDVIAVMKNATREGMAGDAGIPFHPGALRYYREQGWVD